MTGEMSQWLRTLAALANDMGSEIPHGDSQPYLTPVLQDPMPTSDIFRDCMHVVYRHAFRQKTCVHTIFKKLILK